MSGNFHEGEPPDGLHRGIMFVSPERREMLICPDCGDVTTVDAWLLASATILGGQAFPVCNRCGTQYSIVQQQEVYS